MEVIIKNKESRDYYTVGKLDFYWESMARHLGDTVELVKSESVGKQYKRLVFTVEVLDVNKFEEFIKNKAFNTWDIERDYKFKDKKKSKASNKKSFKEVEIKLF